MGNAWIVHVRGPLGDRSLPMTQTRTPRTRNQEPGVLCPKKSPAPIAWSRAYTWRRPTLTGPIVPLPSALQRFTSGFGMGPGGSTALWSPEGNPVSSSQDWDSGGLRRGHVLRPGNRGWLFWHLAAPQLPSSCPLSDIHMETALSLCKSFLQTANLAARVACGRWIPFEFKFRNQDDRMISTGKLNALPHLHFRPIDVVVFDDP